MDSKKESNIIAEFKRYYGDALAEFDERIESLGDQIYEVRAERDAFILEVSSMLTDSSKDSTSSTTHRKGVFPKKTVLERIADSVAMRKGKGKFKRLSIHKDINEDGYGVVPDGTFGQQFTKAVKGGIVKLVSAKHGSSPAAYCHPDDYEEIRSSVGLGLV